MKEPKKLLREEIVNEISNLQSLTPGSEEHATAVESLAKLYKLNIEEIKCEQEHMEKIETRNFEIEQAKLDRSLKERQIDAEIENRDREDVFKRFQFDKQSIDQYIKYGLEAAGIVIPLMFYASWMKKGFKFEETGTFTSTTFRGLFQKFKPTKK